MGLTQLAQNTYFFLTFGMYLNLSGFAISQFTVPGCVSQFSSLMHICKGRPTKREKLFRNQSAKMLCSANKMHSVDV